MVKRETAPMPPASARQIAADVTRLGQDVRQARLARGWIQAQVAAAAGIARSTLSELETGGGGGHTLHTWLRVGQALSRPLHVRLERDPADEPIDAGHLAIQELVLRLAETAWMGAFEAMVPRSTGRHSSDLTLRQRASGAVVLVECWNTIEDLGAAARSSAWKVRKVDEANLAAMRPGDALPVPARSCWVVRGSRRNRVLLDRYPALLEARFPGSSHGWVQALTTGVLPPREPGIVWCDVATTRLIPWRRRG